MPRDRVGAVRPERASLPSWPALRGRALLNGLALLAAGIGLAWLCWSVLDFTVYDASARPWFLRLLAVGLAAGLPVAWICLGLHLVMTAFTARDRLLVHRGAAAWTPAEGQAVLRGVRVRGWRLHLRGEGRRWSAPTLGWLPVLSPLALGPLVAGIAVLLGFLAWMVRGYGWGVLGLLICALWLGWRLLRAVGALQDAAHRTDDEPPATPPEGMPLPPRDGHPEHDTAPLPHPRRDPADEPTEDTGRITAVDSRGGGHHDAPETDAETTRLLPAYRRRGDDPDASDDAPAPSPEPRVDRSVQRAVRARQARKERGASRAEERRVRRGGGAPSAREVEREIYGQEESADSLLGYVRRGRRPRR